MSMAQQLLIRIYLDKAYSIYCKKIKMYKKKILFLNKKNWKKTK